MRNLGSKEKAKVATEDDGENNRARPAGKGPTENYRGLDDINRNHSICTTGRVSKRKNRCITGSVVLIGPRGCHRVHRDLSSAETDAGEGQVR